MDAMFDVPVTVKSMVQAGKAKIIGIATEERFSAMKEIETFKEIGIDLVLGSWVGLLAHKKTPQAILKRLATDLEKTTKNPEFLKALTNADTYLGFLPPEDFTKFLAEEDRFTKRMCEALGIKPQKMP